MRRLRRRDLSVSNVAALLGGAGLTATGLWAFVDPAAFYRRVATYPPYNVHFVHDIGAFLAGLGVGLLAALLLTDVLAVALLANSVAAVLHAVSHIEDRHLGGSSSDPWTLGGFAVMLVVATVLRIRANAPRDVR